jgi:uncharacterized integral membrane protein
VLRLIAAAGLIAAFLAALIFAWVNTQDVTIDYLSGTVETRLTLALFVALATGWVIGVASGLALMFRQRRDLGRLRSQLARTESELEGLRQSLAPRDGR